MKKSIRFNLVMPEWLYDSLKETSEKKGIAMSEYIKDVLKDQLKKDKKQANNPLVISTYPGP